MVFADKLNFNGKQTSKLCFSHFSTPFSFHLLLRISFTINLAFVFENQAFFPLRHMWYVGRTNN